MSSAPLSEKHQYKLQDLWYLAPGNKLFSAPDRKTLPWGSVDEVLPRMPSGERDQKGNERMVSASEWLKRSRVLGGLTWFPGEGPLVRDKSYDNGEWIDHPGALTFNLYQSPKRPDLSHVTSEELEVLVQPWLSLLQEVFCEENDAKHILGWFAHRTQRPYEKPNHGLVFAGEPGIGKDSIIEPLKAAVGQRNTTEIAPQRLFDSFTEYRRHVLIIISELRHMGETKSRELYESTKTLLAGPPRHFSVNEKFLPPYAVPNVCGVIFTTNNALDGLYIPQGCRRYFVAASPKPNKWRTEAEWTEYWNWLDNGGRDFVVEFLHRYDFAAAGFSPHAKPPETEAYRQSVRAAMSPDEVELASTVEELNEDAFILEDLYSTEDRSIFTDQKRKTRIPIILDRVGYSVISNPSVTDGRWVLMQHGVRVKRFVYARKSLTHALRIQAAEKRVKSGVLRKVKPVAA